MFRSTLPSGAALPHLGPSPLRKFTPTFSETLWRWSKSSGDVWCGTWLAVHAMLRCVFETDPVPFANDRLYARPPLMWFTRRSVNARSMPRSVAKSLLRNDANEYGADGMFATWTRSRTSL